MPLFNRASSDEDISARRIGRDDGTGIKLRHPSAVKRESLPDDLRVDREMERLRALFASTPVDHLSIDVCDASIRRRFRRCTVFEDQKRQRWNEYSIEVAGETQTVVTDLEEQVDEASDELDLNELHLENCIVDLAGAPPEPEPEPETDHPAGGPRPVPGPSANRPRRPVHRSSVWRFLLTVVVGLYAVGVDAFNFKGLLDLINNTLTEEQNTILAAGFSTTAAGCAVALGACLGRMRKGKRAGSMVAVTIFSAILLGMITISFLIRGLNGQAEAPDPYGSGAAAKIFNPFGGDVGWLAAAFFTIVLAATSWMTVEETRLITKFAPYHRAVKAVAASRTKLRIALADLALATSIRDEWLAQDHLSVEARNSEINGHATDSDDLFVEARRRLAERIDDPVILDSLKFAPQIDLTRDVPLMNPPFYGPPATGAAAADTPAA